MTQQVERTADEILLEALLEMEFDEDPTAPEFEIPLQDLGSTSDLPA